MNVGFIGLGTMGQPMAEHLLRGGFRLHVWSRRLASADSLLQQGAHWCESPATLARGCDIVCSNVTDSADVASLAAAMEDALPAGAIHVDFSTIAPSVARRIAGRYAARDIDFVDAPVSGGGAGARAASLAIMWGGRAALAPRLAPLFACLGKTIVHVGEAGAGQVAKACNQMIMVAGIEACAEAARLADASGIDFAKVRLAMLAGSAGSRVLEVFGGRMAERNFAASVAARLHHKDFGLLQGEAAALGVPLPIASAVSQQLNALMAQGFGEADTASLLRILESPTPTGEPT